MNEETVPCSLRFKTITTGTMLNSYTIYSNKTCIPSFLFVISLIRKGGFGFGTLWGAPLHATQSSTVDLHVCACACACVSVHCILNKSVTGCLEISTEGCVISTDRKNKLPSLCVCVCMFVHTSNACLYMCFALHTASYKEWVCGCGMWQWWVCQSYRM